MDKKSALTSIFFFFIMKKLTNFGENFQGRIICLDRVGSNFRDTLLQNHQQWTCGPSIRTQVEQINWRTSVFCPGVLTGPSISDRMFVILSQSEVSCGSATVISLLFTQPDPPAVSTDPSDDLCIFMRAIYKHICNLWVLTCWKSKNQKRRKTSFLWIYFSECGGGELHTGVSWIHGRGLRRHLLALCVVILNQVLQEVHSFLGLDLIYFDQVLQRRGKNRCRVQKQQKVELFSCFNEQGSAFTQPGRSDPHVK